MVDTLIFDWDGTLVDSVSKIVAAMQLAADQVGLPPASDEAVRGIIGLGLPEAIAVLYPQLDDPALIERLGRAYSNTYLELEQKPSPMFDGVLEALHGWRRQGLRLAVATGKSRRGLERILRLHDLQRFFDATRCADETASKPDPRMLYELLGELDRTPQQAVMVGDSGFDLQMAHNAGVTPIAVSYGAQSRELLLPHAPAVCLDHFQQLDVWLASRLAGRSYGEIV